MFIIMTDGCQSTCAYNAAGTCRLSLLTHIHKSSIFLGLMPLPTLVVYLCGVASCFGLVSAIALCGFSIVTFYGTSGVVITGSNITLGYGGVTVTFVGCGLSLQTNFLFLLYRWPMLSSSMMYTLGLTFATHDPLLRAFFGCVGWSRTDSPVSNSGIKLLGMFVKLLLCLLLVYLDVLVNVFCNPWF